MPTYECFLGALASSEEIFIKEAGEHCRRDIDPYRYSMQLNKTRACPKIETKVEIPPFREIYDEKGKSVSTVSPDERASANGEVEYEYFDENMNIHGNVISSTESKVQVNVKENGDNPNAVDDRMTNEVFHPIHPKIDLGVSKTTTHSGSCSKLSDFTLISNLLTLSLMLVNCYIRS